MYKILAKPLFLGKQVFYMPTCHSTNDIAMDIVDKPDTHEGCIVITDNQTSGKGQRGNTWISEPGKNLTFSIILQPGFLELKHQFRLNMVVSTAICDVLSKYLPDEDVKIKWPNDIYINNRKAAGILIENGLNPPYLEHSVVGIGLNVNQKRFSTERTTSLGLITGDSLDLTEVLGELVFGLERRYLELKSNRYEEIKTDYLANLLGLNQLRRFYSEHEFEGTITGISEAGKLCVKIGTRIREFDLKEIRFL